MLMTDCKPDYKPELETATAALQISPVYCVKVQVQEAAPETSQTESWNH